MTGGKYNNYSKAEMKSIKRNLNNSKGAQERIFRPGNDEATGNWAILHNIIHPLVTCIKRIE
jgi:hypothetical protein